MSGWSMSPGDWEYVFRSGLRLQVTPEGDCQEATFIAKGQGVGLQPLDAVTISVDGQPLFYGEVRVGGNSQDVNGHQFTLRSLALRLKEVVIPDDWSAPQQNAAATIQSLIQAVLPQLGGAISIGSISASFDCRAVKNANQQNPYALLEQIAQDGAVMGEEYRFGVNANRQFFFGPRNRSSMGLPGNLTAACKWTGPVAETPCTAVLWYISKRPDGSWVTHLSQSPEVGRYGIRIKAVSLTSSEGLWETITGGSWESLRTNNDTHEQTHTPLTAEQISILTDTNRKEGVGDVYNGWLNVVFRPSISIDRYTVSATAQNQPALLPQGVAGGWVVDESAWSAQRAGWYYEGAAAGTLTKTYLCEKEYRSLPFTVGNIGLPQHVVKDAQGKETWAADSMQLTVFKLIPERLKTELLDQLAKYHYNIPANSAGEIEATGLTLGLGGESPWGPVAAIEYRITAARGICTALMIGQADDPNKLAQAALIKARDQQAVIHAITSNI